VCFWYLQPNYRLFQYFFPPLANEIQTVYCLLSFRSDGTFSVHNLPSGESYVIEVVNPVYFFEPIRVDISSRGSIRARKLNHLKPSAVSTLKYPLELKPLGMTKHFQVREKFSILDMLKSPMVSFIYIFIKFWFEWNWSREWSIKSQIWIFIYFACRSTNFQSCVDQKSFETFNLTINRIVAGLRKR